jgi:hypothetical protein
MAVAVGTVVRVVTAAAAVVTVAIAVRAVSAATMTARRRNSRPRS